jgi:cytochrome c-type biogenesis protein CcmH/NrfG
MMLRTLAALLLLALPATAQADWYEASTPHFLVYADRDPEKLKAFATNLERLDRAIRLMVGGGNAEASPASRVTVFTVDDTIAVERLIGRRGVAGFFIPRASGSVAIVPEQGTEGGALALKPLQILLHEYAHNLMWSLDPDTGYPSWLVEGFAEFNATARFGKDGSVTLGEPPLYRGISVMGDAHLPMDKLLTVDSKTLDRDEIDGFYGRAWLLTHYLRLGAPQRSTQLSAYVAALKAGKTTREAAKVFGNLKQLDGELDVYKKRHLGIATLSGAQLAIGPVEVHKLSAAAAAVMDVRIRSKVAVSPETVQPIYAEAQRAAAPWPNDPDAQLVLAGAAIDAGDYPGAQAAVDRALAADPKRVRALTLDATARMLEARKAKDARPESWNAVRAILSVANKLDPRDPMPLWLYYRSYVEQGVPAPEIAKDGLATAFKLAPYDYTLRMTTAGMYLGERNGTGARVTLLPLVNDPHSGPRGKQAAAAIERIDAGDLAGAVAALTGKLEKGDAAND